MREFQFTRTFILLIFYKLCFTEASTDNCQLKIGNDCVFCDENYSLTKQNQTNTLINSVCKSSITKYCYFQNNTECLGCLNPYGIFQNEKYPVKTCLMNYIQNCEIYTFEGDCAQCKIRKGIFGVRYLDFGLSWNNQTCFNNLNSDRVKGCLRYSSSNICLECHEAYVHSIIDNKCYIDQQSMCRTKNSTNCIVCQRPEEYVISENILQCVKMIKNCILHSWPDGDCQKCSPDYFYNIQTKTCEKYIKQCDNQVNTTQCIVCAQGLYFNQNLMECLPAILISNCALYNQELKKCLQCENGFALNFDRTECFENTAHCLRLDFNNRGCFTCQNGYVIDQIRKNCVSPTEFPKLQNCQYANFFTNSPKLLTGLWVCEECLLGYFLGSDFECYSQIETNCLQGISDTHCLLCFPGFYLLNGACIQNTVVFFEGCRAVYTNGTCIWCETNYYLDSSIGICTKIFENKIQNCLIPDNNSTKCEYCSPNYFLNSDGSACVPEVQNCLIPSNQDPSQCSVCQFGYTITSTSNDPNFGMCVQIQGSYCTTQNKLDPNKCDSCAFPSGQSDGPVTCVSTTKYCSNYDFKGKNCLGCATGFIFNGTHCNLDTTNRNCLKYRLINTFEISKVYQCLKCNDFFSPAQSGNCIQFGDSQALSLTCINALNLTYCQECHMLYSQLTSTDTLGQAICTVTINFCQTAILNANGQILCQQCNEGFKAVYDSSYFPPQITSCIGPQQYLEFTPFCSQLEVSYYGCAKCSQEYVIWRNRCVKYVQNCEFYFSLGIDSYCVKCQFPFFLNSDSKTCEKIGPAQVSRCMTVGLPSGTSILDCSGCSIGYEIAIDEAKNKYYCSATQQISCVEGKIAFKSKFGGGSFCVTSVLNCAQYFYWNLCSSCLNGYVLAYTFKSCLSEQEVTWIPNCQRMQSMTSCSYCQLGFILSNTSLNCTSIISGCLQMNALGTICEQCDSNYGLSSDFKVCIPSANIINCLYYLSQEKCFKCKEGFILNKDFICQADINGCNQLVSPDFTNCKSCYSHMFKLVNKTGTFVCEQFYDENSDYAIYGCLNYTIQSNGNKLCNACVEEDWVLEKERGICINQVFEYSIKNCSIYAPIQSFENSLQCLVFTSSNIKNVGNIILTFVDLCFLMLFLSINICFVF